METEGTMKDLFFKAMGRFSNRFRRVTNCAQWGNLRSLKPISSVFGTDRGQPIDRYYIEQFLRNNSTHIQGRVLEIADNQYTVKYGNHRVHRSDVLHAEEGNPRATIVGDLTHGKNIEDDSFDCIICTQTLHCIYELAAAVSTIGRILKPGGSVLATFPGISQISRYDMDRWGDYWRFTSRSSRELFEKAMPSNNVTVNTYGNVLTAIAFLHGLAAEELSHEELNYKDQDYEVLVVVRAVKS